MNRNNKNIQQIQYKIKNEQEKMLSLKNLEQKDFPAFYTIKNFVIMIDGVLDKPFFTRIQQQDLSKQQEQEQFEMLGWKQQKEDTSKFKIQVRRLTNQNKKKYKKLAEITYDQFLDQFWSCIPNYLQDSELLPPIIWSEIYSVIKGSVKAHTLYCKYLSEVQYLKQSNNKFYQVNDKKVIYKIFEYYESWKKDTYHYDFMDVVNNCLYQIKANGYKGPVINYLFIDQVQDLTPATIYLLSKIVTDGVFYSGDTAQAIVKGVSFRFSDIKTMYHEKFQLEKLPNGKPNQTQLTVNFRSHNQILQLANTVVSSIQILFAKTIDSLKKQTSSLNGPKPFIISSRKQVDIFKLLCSFNDAQIYQNQQEEWQIKSKKIQSQSKKNRTIFTSQQIIIVRNLEQKQKLPSDLKHGIVLTIQQAKGLQYQDVILYNFFQSCKCRDKWKLIQYILIEQELVEKSKYESLISRVQGILNLDPQSFNIQLQLIKLGNDWFYKVKKLKIDPKILGIDKNKYIQLLTQLKILYTIITRAKISFLIFDSKISQCLLKIWKQLKLIKFIIESNDFKQQNSKLLQYKEKHSDIKKFVNQQQAWRDQGYKLYTRKNYDEAIKCYQMSNDYQIVTRIKAQKFSKQAFTMEKRQNNQFKNPKKLGINQFKVLCIYLKMQHPQILNKFEQAGKLFEQVKRYKDAGKCYLSAQKYQNSLNCFRICGFIQGIAFSCFKLEKYQQAAYQYEKLEKYQKMLECYFLGHIWNVGIKKMFQHQNKLQSDVLQLYFRKFAKKALRSQLTNSKQKYSENNLKTQQLNNLYKSQFGSYKLKTFIQDFSTDRYTRIINQRINKVQEISRKIQFYKLSRNLFASQQQLQISPQNNQPFIGLQQKQLFQKNFNTYLKDIKLFKQKYGSINQCLQKLENLVQYLDTIKDLNDQQFFQSQLKKQISQSELTFKDKIIKQDKFKQLLKFTKKIIDKTYKYLINLNKLTMNSQHPQYWLKKNQQQYINKNLAQGKQNIQMLQKIQIIGQHQLCIFLSIFLCISQNTWKYILSYCLQFSRLYKSGSKINNNGNNTKPFNSTNKINQFLHTIKINGYKKQIQITLLYKEPMANIICEGLILQGSYLNTLNFLNENQYCLLAYTFSNYNLFMSKIKQTKYYNKTLYMTIQQFNKHNKTFWPNQLISFLCSTYFLFILYNRHVIKFNILTYDSKGGTLYTYLLIQRK